MSHQRVIHRRGAPAHGSMGRATLPLALTIVLTFGVGTIFVWLRDTSPAINDTIGYVHAATRMATGYGPTYADIYNAAIAPVFSMAAFQIEHADGLMYLGFPPGFPALLAFALRLTQYPEAVHLVTPLLGALTIPVAFLLGAYAGTRWWNGVWTALIVAAMPDLWRFATAAWSDVPSMLVISTAAALFVAGRQRQGRMALALTGAAGLLLAYSIFLRYANVVVFPAFAAYDLWQTRRHMVVAWARFPFYLPLAVSVLAVPVFNASYYGGPFITSYSPIHGWYPLSPFSWRYALGPSFIDGHSLTETLRTLWQNLGVALILAPLGWVRMPRANAILCAGAAMATVILYSMYAFAPTGINSRFLLPAMPFFAAGAAHAILIAGAAIPRPSWRIAAGVGLAVLVAWPTFALVDELSNRNDQYAATAERARMLAAETPGDAVFIAYALGDHIAFYGQRSILNYRRIPTSDPDLPGYRLEELEPCLVQIVARLLDQNIPVYYLEDSAPPFWDSLALLQRHFTLQRVRDDLPLYGVAAGNDQPAHGSCPILRPAE